MPVTWPHPNPVQLSVRQFSIVCILFMRLSCCSVLRVICSVDPRQYLKDILLTLSLDLHTLSHSHTWRCRNSLTLSDVRLWEDFYILSGALLPTWPYLLSITSVRRESRGWSGAAAISGGCTYVWPLVHSAHQVLLTHDALLSAAKVLRPLSF